MSLSNFIHVIFYHVERKLNLQLKLRCSFKTKKLYKGSSNKCYIQNPEFVFFALKEQDCQGQWPSFSFILALSFLSTSKRVIVNCINVTQQVSVNAKAGIKVICYPFVSSSPYKQQLIKYLFFISLYHYYRESVVQAGIRTHDLMNMSSTRYP